MIPDINIKYKNYEFRSVNAKLIRDWKLETVELVKWNKDHCFTLLYWKKEKKGFNITFIGERPFENIKEKDVMEIWRIMSLIQKYLNNLID